MDDDESNANVGSYDDRVIALPDPFQLAGRQLEAEIGSSFWRGNW
jgi:hypothetical protein